MSKAGRHKKNLAFVDQTRPSDRVDIGVYVSEDNRRLTCEMPSPRKKRRSRVMDAAQLNEGFNDWLPMDASPDPEQSDSEPIPQVVSNIVSLGKRKRYLSSVSLASSTNLLVQTCS